MTMCAEEIFNKLMALCETRKRQQSEMTFRLKRSLRNNTSGNLSVTYVSFDVFLWIQDLQLRESLKARNDIEFQFAMPYMSFHRTKSLRVSTSFTRRTNNCATIKVFASKMLQLNFRFHFTIEIPYHWIFSKHQTLERDCRAWNNNRQLDWWRSQMHE